MAETTMHANRPEGLEGFIADWSSDQRAFKRVSWGKAMMWIFLLSDTFVFSIFLLGYMSARMSTQSEWPNTSEVFSLHVGGVDLPLLLIAIMTFILISSSGTMAMAVRCGYARARRQTAALMYLTALLGATFVGMQAFEWPNTSEVFSLHVGGVDLPLLLIAIMTFVLISSSGTMAMAVRCGYARARKQTAALMYVTALLGATFVGMQAFEWTKLISEGVRPWSNPFGAEQFGATFFMITGFHGTHVSFGVLFLIIIATKIWRGDFDRPGRTWLKSGAGDYEAVEIMGLYWHFVDLVWVFIFAFFYLW